MIIAEKTTIVRGVDFTASTAEELANADVVYAAAAA
jgi:hypothetical protein